MSSIAFSATGYMGPLESDSRDDTGYPPLSETEMGEYASDLASLRGMISNKDAIKFVNSTGDFRTPYVEVSVDDICIKDGKMEVFDYTRPIAGFSDRDFKSIGYAASIFYSNVGNTEAFSHIKLADYVNTFFRLAAWKRNGVSNDRTTKLTGAINTIARAFGGFPQDAWVPS